MVDACAASSGAQPDRRRTRTHPLPASRMRDPMSRPTNTRLGTLLTAATAALATLAMLPAAVGAAGPGRAPVLDGWRSAPAVVTVTAHSIASVSASASRTTKRVQPTAVSPAGGDPCSDRAYNHGESRWSDTFRWSFFAASTPSGIRKVATERVLKRSVANMTDGRNDCGRTDRIRATAIYQGRTLAKPAPTSSGGCGGRDGVNVIGFGKLPPGIAGLTCVWSSGGRIIEADIKLDKNARWATSLASCSFASMVEAVATHEFGHAFGMGHVKETTHGRLTMSERLDGYCQLNEASLGKGDLLGMEDLY